MPVCVSFCSFTVDAVDSVEYCHGFDLSKWEQDMSLFSSVVIVHVDNDPAFFVKKVISAVHSFVSLCSKESVVGRIILDVAEILGQDVKAFSRLIPIGTTANGAVFSTSLPSSLQQLRFVGTPFG